MTKPPKYGDGTPGAYDVGYKKPPIQHRFQKGQSGNPRGRPKKRFSLDELFEEQLDEKVQIMFDGELRTISLRLNGPLTIIRKAIANDKRALRKMVSVIRRLYPADASPAIQVVYPPGYEPKNTS